MNEAAAVQHLLATLARADWPFYVLGGVLVVCCLVWPGLSTPLIVGLVVVGVGLMAVGLIGRRLRTGRAERPGA